ncbi:hypothetical protein [Flagellimonas baculiformis]|uniref:hypothetical protein n=1 Tax=Flagellimonas baculiformis TaxID=3067310 RepID=UPI00296EC326|nr:hypothetical protein [Muricauda sp. D6]
MKEKYIEDLSDIKKIMDRSTRFLSLSGLAGISTGISALVGVYVAYEVVFKGNDYLVPSAVELANAQKGYLLLIALGTLALSIGSAMFFTVRNTKKRNQRAWNTQSKELLVNLLIPLVAGGILCLMLLSRGFLGFLPSLTLLFYGLALVNGSRNTLPEIRNLGLIQIGIGLVAFQFMEYGLFLWAVGFGFFQIVYGAIVQKKYR